MLSCPMQSGELTCNCQDGVDFLSLFFPRWPDCQYKNYWKIWVVEIKLKSSKRTYQVQYIYCVVPSCTEILINGK